MKGSVLLEVMTTRLHSCLQNVQSVRLLSMPVCQLAERKEGRGERRENNSTISNVISTRTTDRCDDRTRLEPNKFPYPVVLLRHTGSREYHPLLPCPELGFSVWEGED